MKKAARMIYTLCALALPLVLPACAGQEPALTQAMLLHHNFELVSVDGREYTGKNAPTLAFDEGMRVSGSICNRFTGQGLLKEAMLTVNQPASTKKLCFEPELNRYETLISDMLMQGVKLDYTDQILTMTGTEHTVVYRLRDFIN